MEQTTIPEASGRKFYRYYQEGEYTHWKIKHDPNPNDPWTFVENTPSERVSILCVSEDIDIAPDRAKVAYTGPLFFDIDDKDLMVALRASNQLVAKLLALGVAAENIDVHLSGKKGVHIYLDQRVFASNEDLESTFLPEIYAKMAMHLWVDGMDFQVYSGGKGRQVRPPNAKRPDGKYKVQIPLEVLREITVEDYQLLVEKPQPLIPRSEPKLATKLSKLFNSCKEAASRLSTISSKNIVPADMAKLGAEIPSCVAMLAEGKRKKLKGDGNTSFNSIAMQVGCWSKFSVIDQALLDGLHERIAKNCPSSTGESSHSRVRKLQSMHHYLKTQEKYTFSCAAVKKLIDGAPACGVCPIYDNMKATNLVADALHLTEHQGQYYADKDKTILVAPFTMVRDAVVIEETTRKSRYSTVTINVPLSGESFKLDHFSEDAWLSKANFKKEISGLDGAVFLGSDNDVAKLRSTLIKDDIMNGAEVKQIIEARVIGLNYRRRSGSTSPRDPSHVGRLIYIEPGFSINDVGIQDTHIISGAQPQGAPHMKIHDFYDPINDKANDAFSLLMKTNTPDVVATMLGWFLATHLKSHFYTLEGRFPLMCLSGVAGTGKNSSVAVFMRICGVEGEKALMTLEAPNCTHFPFQQALSDSATIPRVINELNPKSLNYTRYRQVIELLKAAFDSRDINRGKIGGGDRHGVNVSTQTWKISAPVVTLSEEPIQDPAVLQRAFMVNLSPAGLITGRAMFHVLEPRADDLVDIGRALISSALQTKIQEVITMLDSMELPEGVHEAGVPERLKYSYRVVLVAYDWAIDRLERMGLSEQNLTDLRNLRAVFYDHLSTAAAEIAAESRVSEVDLVLKSFAVLANNGNSTERLIKIVKGEHYALLDNILYIDVQMAYPVLQAYSKSIGQNLGIRDEKSFTKLVRSMPYFISDKAVCNLLPTGGRAVLALNVGIMADREIPIAMFQ